MLPAGASGETKSTGVGKRRGQRRDSKMWTKAQAKDTSQKYGHRYERNCVGQMRRRKV